MYPSSYTKHYNRSYFHFHKTYGYRTWQTGELRWGTTTSKVTWPCDQEAIWSRVTNKKRYISTFQRSMTAKLGKVEIYSKGPPPIKLTWSSDHVIDKNVIFQLPQDRWLPNLTKWWVLIQVYHLQSHITGWSRGSIRSYNKRKTL